MVKKGRLPQVPWLSFLSTSAFWANILGDPPFGISIMAYCSNMVYPFWDLSFGQTHRDVAKITAHGFRAPKYSGGRNGFDSNANGVTVHLSLNPHL